MTTVVGTPPGVTASGFRVKPPVDPATIPGLAAWWDAADTATITASAGKVTAWNDKTPNGLHLNTSLVGTINTGTRTMNGHNVLDFTGPAAGIATTGTLTQAQPVTMFVVLDVDSTPAGNTYVVGLSTTGTAPAIARFSSLWGMYCGGNVVYGNINADLNPHVLSYLYQGSTSKLWLDGLDDGGGDTGTGGFTGGRLNIGTQGPGNTTFPFVGGLAEVLIYGRALTTIERTDLQSYLKQKWATP